MPKKKKKKIVLKVDKITLRELDKLHNVFEQLYFYDRKIRITIEEIK